RSRQQFRGGPVDSIGADFQGGRSPAPRRHASPADAAAAYDDVGGGITQKASRNIVLAKHEFGRLLRNTADELMAWKVTTSFSGVCGFFPAGPTFGSLAAALRPRYLPPSS